MLNPIGTNLPFNFPGSINKDFDLPSIPFGAERVIDKNQFIGQYTDEVLDTAEAVCRSVGLSKANCNAFLGRAIQVATLHVQKTAARLAAEQATYDSANAALQNYYTVQQQYATALQKLQDDTTLYNSLQTQLPVAEQAILQNTKAAAAAAAKAGPMTDAFVQSIMALTDISQLNPLITTTINTTYANFDASALAAAQAYNTPEYAMALTSTEEVAKDSDMINTIILSLRQANPQTITEAITMLQGNLQFSPSNLIQGFYLAQQINKATSIDELQAALNEPPTASTQFLPALISAKENTAQLWYNQWLLQPTSQNFTLVKDCIRGLASAKMQLALYNEVQNTANNAYNTALATYNSMLDQLANINLSADQASIDSLGLAVANLGDLATLKLNVSEASEELTEAKLAYQHALRVLQLLQSIQSRIQQTRSEIKKYAPITPKW